MAARPLDLPSLSTTVVALEDGAARIRFSSGECVDLTPWGVGARSARVVARALARLQDPEVIAVGNGLPGTVPLGSLLGLSGSVDDRIAANWRHRTGRPVTPIGIAESGPLLIDLVADGPHALLGGTTGAGKSELLRSLVAGLGVTSSPTELNFVLIDYKGGSAFDVCAALPHTVGLVTDLDEHLAARALSCLEAELRYREHRLREAGVSDIADYPHGLAGPLPRLLVAIDEFAALAKELPDFIDALVGIAQRGRSLGVHLLLATQRPGGVISDNIKANTNLRIALRVQDSSDSVDVVGIADATAIGRNQPGRGLARLGPRDVIPFQTALVTGRSLGAGRPALAAAPFVFAGEQPQATAASPPATGGEPTDLELVVAAAQRVAASLRLPEPRSPWPAALPGVIDLPDLDQVGTAAPFALADEPHRQRRVVLSWSPGDGNVLIYGLPGSGTTTALATLAVSLARCSDADRLHIYVLDFDDQLLAPLRALPHVGSVIGATDRERQLRLFRRLSDEMQERRHAVAEDPAALDSVPTVVALLDNYGGFAATFDEPGDLAIRNLLTRVIADGPGVGMFTIVTAKQPGDVPARVGSLVATKLVFRLADRYDYSGLGLTAVSPPATPGRAFEAPGGREVQVARPGPAGLAVAVAAVASDPPRHPPWRIDVLPSEVSVAEVVTSARIVQNEWFLPLGIGDTALAPAGLVLRDGEHALITGPARSGKSTALATVAAVARAAQHDIRITAVLPRVSSLAKCSAVDEVVQPADIAGLTTGRGRRLLLIDDAELVGDVPHLGELLRARHPGIRVIAAGSADAIRGLYGHWTQTLRSSRIGCALRPNLAADGDLWQTPLPRRVPGRFPVGRGYLLAEGRVELVQLGRG